MNDRSIELLEKYDMEVLRTGKGRGVLLCDTDKGKFVLKEYTGSEEHAKLQNMLLEKMTDTISVEHMIPDKEGNLLVKDADGVAYVLKTRQDGRECNINDSAERQRAVELLAGLHDCMELTPEELPAPVQPFSQLKEYEKHNREIKKIKKYLKQKGQKQLFERDLMNACDYFLEQALEITEEWAYYNDIYGKRTDVITFCHGDYQHHNILFGAEGWFVANFEKCMPDRPIRDLYLFLRKLLEKSNWSMELGYELIGAYDNCRKLTAEDRIDLYYRLAYPEKFWKIVNFYYNTGKAWIPEKNSEKLDKLLKQEKNKQQFLNEVFRDLR